MTHVPPAAPFELQSPDPLPPTTIFTLSLTGDGREPRFVRDYLAVGVVEALSPLLKDVQCLCLSKETDISNFDMSRAVAIFGDPRPVPAKGLRSFRYLNGFPKGSLSAPPAWTRAAKWAVSIHQNEPQVIAQELAEIFGKNFLQSVERCVILASKLSTPITRVRRPYDHFSPHERL